MLVDWHKGAAGGNYPSAARNVMMLARTSAEFLNRLMMRYKLVVGGHDLVKSFVRT